MGRKRIQKFLEFPRTRSELFALQLLRSILETVIIRNRIIFIDMIEELFD